MILQIDAGNTRVHWRVLEPVPGAVPVVRERGSVPHGTAPSPRTSGGFSVVELACVAGGEVRNSLEWDFQIGEGVPVYEARARARQCGVRNSYSDPGTMGVDRWLAMIAAFNEYPGGVIVVDAGTAVTVDYVNASGEHLGGYILPGLHLMLGSLGRNTARVRWDQGNVGPASPGQSTGECVNQGIGWMWSAAAERLRQDRLAFGVKTIVVTGGDAAFFADLLGSEAVVEQDLVFMGMDRVFSDAPFRSALRD